MDTKETLQAVATASEAVLEDRIGLAEEIKRDIEVVRQKRRRLACLGAVQAELTARERVLIDSARAAPA